MSATLDVMSPSKGRPLVSVRVPPDFLAEADRLAEAASTPLRSVNRADVLRRALELGLGAVAEEIGAPSASKARKAKT